MAFAKSCVFILCLTLLSTQSVFSASASESSCSRSEPVIFGILPFIRTEQLVKRFAPLADYLSARLGVAVRIETAPDFAEFARRTNQQARYDLLFTAPHFFPKASSLAGYRLIASVDSSGMWAVIVAPRNSAIHTLDDLRGKRLATLPPAALATLLVRKHLRDAGIDPDRDLTLVHTPSHDASLLSAYHGVTDASALMSPPYEAASRILRDAMRIVATTETTPHIPISVSPAVSDACANEIKQVLLEMNQTDAGKAVLKYHRFTGFREAQPHTYDSMKQLFEP